MDKQDMLDRCLLEAVRCHDKGNVELLISQGADVNKSFQIPELPSGITPLIGAIFVNDIEILKFLLKKGADANKKVCMNGTDVTAITFAKAINRMDIANFLEQSC